MANRVHSDPGALDSPAGGGMRNTELGAGTYVWSVHLLQLALILVSFRIPAPLLQRWMYYNPLQKGETTLIQHMEEYDMEEQYIQ